MAAASPSAPAAHLHRISTTALIAQSTNAFQSLYSEEQRRAMTQRLRKKYPDRVPLIAVRRSGSLLPGDPFLRMLPPSDATFRDLVCEIRKRTRVSKEQALFLFTENNTLPYFSETIGAVASKHAHRDGFLYIIYSEEDAFGIDNDVRHTKGGEWRGKRSKGNAAAAVAPACACSAVPRRREGNAFFDLLLDPTAPYCACKPAMPPGLRHCPHCVDTAHALPSDRSPDVRAGNSARCLSMPDRNLDSCGNTAHAEFSSGMLCWYQHPCSRPPPPEREGTDSWLCVPLRTCTLF
jgi:GABA(A) receptor-associated protein